MNDLQYNEDGAREKFDSQIITINYKHTCSEMFIRFTMRLYSQVGDAAFFCRRDFNGKY